MQCKTYIGKSLYVFELMVESQCWHKNCEGRGCPLETFITTRSLLVTSGCLLLKYTWGRKDKTTCLKSFKSPPLRQHICRFPSFMKQSSILLDIVLENQAYVFILSTMAPLLLNRWKWVCAKWLIADLKYRLVITYYINYLY